MMVRRYAVGGDVEGNQNDFGSGNDYGVGGGYDFGMRDSLDSLIGGVDQYSGPMHNSAWGREDAIDRGLPEGIVDSLNQAWSNPEPGMTPGQSWSAARDNLGVTDVNQNWLERQMGLYEEPTYDPVANRMGSRYSGMDLNVPGLVAGMLGGPALGVGVGALSRSAGVGNRTIDFNRGGQRDEYGNVLVDNLGGMPSMSNAGDMNLGGDGNGGDQAIYNQPAAPPSAPPVDDVRATDSTVRKYMPFPGDPLRYGEGPGWNFYPQVKAAKGTYVEGPGAGQDDKVPALLSDGEFVIPADVVSMLGDGSSKAGAERLYSLMDEVRSHKATDKHPPKARSPLQYMRGK
jgi:hypothetical protein